ncbi:MAG: hypothetical protein ACYTGW_11600 [Planctomycetota bacterium]|jgi:uncharacterized membrane protein
MLTLIQDPAETAVQTERKLEFLNMPELWIVGLVILPLTVAFAWWSYGGARRLEPRIRLVLSLLRGLTILVCLLAISQPIFELIQYTNLQTQVHVLVDDSASMQRRDTYPDEDQQEALMDAAQVQNLANFSRSDLVQRVLQRPDGLLKKLRENHDVRLFRFVRKPLPVRDLSELTGKGPRTPLGDALDLHLAAFGAAELEAVILVSDGRNNAGLPPVEVAGKYRAADLPIFTVGVGDPNPPRNVRIIGPPGPKEALREEEIVFDVNLVAEGLNRRVVTVTLEASREGGPYVPVQSSPATLGRDNEPVRVRLHHAFTDPGDYTLRFRSSSFPEETSLEDNVDTRFLRVNDEHVRVLYIDDVPRWEYRYLERGLKRVDPSIEMQAYMFDASRDFHQEHSDNLTNLIDIPRTRKEMFEYHVILIGDVPPEKLGNTEEQRNDWLQLLMEFVEFGGGVGMLWGQEAMPSRYRGTPLEDLLPVVLEDQFELKRIKLDRTKEFRPVLDNPAHPHEISLLRPERRTNQRLWEEDLAALVMYYPVQQVKAGAEAILRHPTDVNRFGKRVIAATGFYPRGRTFFIATDETWRWRKYYGELFHDRFWRNVVRYLAQNRLRRRDDRVELRLSKVVAETGEPIHIHLEVQDEELAPSTESEAVVFIRRADTAPERRTLRVVPGEPGTYKGSFTLDRPASVSVLVFEADNPQDKILAREDVLIEIPDREMSHSSQDQKTLTAIAERSKGGRYVFLGDVHELIPEFLDRKPLEQEINRQTEPIWDQAWVLFLVLALLSAEWLLRKWARLV